MPDCMDVVGKALLQRQRNDIAVAYLLQLVQRTLPDAAFFEVVLRRIHYLLDDLLVDVALSTALAIAVSRALATPRKRTYHQRVRHGRGCSKKATDVSVRPLTEAKEAGLKVCWRLK